MTNSYAAWVEGYFRATKHIVKNNKATLTQLSHSVAFFVGEIIEKNSSKQYSNTVLKFTHIRIEEACYYPTRNQDRTLRADQGIGYLYYRILDTLQLFRIFLASPPF